MTVWRNRPGRWGLAARGLHWAVAALVAAQFVTGWLSEAATDQAISHGLIRTHYQAGMTLMALIALRVLWRLSVTAPEPPPGSRLAMKTAAGVHLALYALLIVLPVSGYLIWIHMDAGMDVFGLVQVPRLITPDPDDERLRAAAWYVHYGAGWMLAGLVCLHIAAAAWHGVRRDGVLFRMV